MSRTRSLNRSSLRALSGSDTEEDVSFSSNRVRLKRNRATAALSHLNSSGDQVSSQSHSDIYVSSNHKSVAESISASSTTSSRATAAKNSYTCTPSGSSGSYQRNASVNSSQANISAVQYSSILDRLRWLLWKYIYLKIIKIVNFDVWLLSRLCGRRRVVIVFLLPLLLYLLYCLFGSGTELASTSLDVLSSSVSALASSVYSLIIFPFQQSEEALKEADPLFSPKRGSFLSAFWGIPSFFSNFFISEKTTSFTSQTTSHTVDSRIKSDNSITKQDIELLAVKTLDARFNELVKKMQTSQDVKAEAMNSLQKEISDLHVQFKSLTSTIQQLEKDIKTDKEHVVVFDSLNIRMKDFEEKLTSLSGLKKCCDEKWTVADFTASIEKHLVTAFRNVLAGEKDTDSPYHFFHQWLNSKFIDPNKLSAEINAAFEKMKRQQSSDIKLDQNSMNVVKSFVQHYVETLKTNLTPAGSTKTTYDNSLTHHDMRRIVKEALMLYDADKTGKVDYALESGGGSILSTRCSESYVEKNGKFTVLGVPLWSDENSPRTAIQPDVQPGKCWAFKGSHGYLVIQLSYTVYPTGFTLEHIPVSLSPSGSIDSAPKDFSVWGLSSDKDFEGTLLGKYTFEIDGEPLQYFEVQNITSVPFSLVELKIHSNHGNLEYTCLYRFRVHGTRA
ncbi:unnamed protein product [Larinioides sclopetarius]|uniref:SUN domain-containing protein n=2 Tax=Larinioides sclopetarius TaxID=280406 RepID=A0AAV1ZMB9_9ARAC